MKAMSMCLRRRLGMDDPSAEGECESRCSIEKVYAVSYTPNGVHNDGVRESNYTRGSI